MIMTSQLLWVYIWAGHDYGLTGIVDLHLGRLHDYGLTGTVGLHLGRS